MTDYETLFAHLQQQAQILDRQTNKLEKIERALTEIAVQEKEIVHINKQISKLWEKYDIAFGPNGIVPGLKAYQASCPEESLRKSMTHLWTALGILAAVIGALKLLG